MPDLRTGVLLGVAVVAGLVVSGLSGFAVSAVAGAILLRVLQLPVPGLSLLEGGPRTGTSPARSRELCRPSSLTINLTDQG